MRRNGPSFLIAVMLAAATWACDDQTPTSPTPLATESADGLTASTATASVNQAIAIGTSSAVQGAKPPKPEKPPKDDGGRFIPTCDSFTSTSGITNDGGMYCDSQAGITADIISDPADGGHNLSIGTRSGRTLYVDLSTCANCPAGFSGGAASVHFLSPLGGGSGPRVNFLTMSSPTDGGVSFTFTVAKRHEIRLDYGVSHLCLAGGLPSKVTKTSDTTWTVAGTSACVSEKVGNTRKTLGVYGIGFSLNVTVQ